MNHSQTPIWKRSRRHYLAVIAVLIVVSGVVYFIYPWLLFQTLKIGDFDARQKDWVVRVLSRSDRGVDFALADINIWGGETSGASWSILDQAKNRTRVIDGLLTIKNDSARSNGDRSAALIILYDIQKTSDYLVEIYRLVQPAGGHDIQIARSYLAGYVGDQVLLGSLEEPLTITVSEFIALLGFESAPNLGFRDDDTETHTVNPRLDTP